MTRVLHFAYGSNMDQEQMKERCPQGEMDGIALLPNHELAFTRYSINRKCGVADVIPTPDSEVWGVLYLLTKDDLESLDHAEGADRITPPNAYDLVTRTVFRDGDRGQAVSAEVYIVPEESRKFHAPNQHYKQLMVNAARVACFPEGYLEKLSAIKVIAQ